MTHNTTSINWIVLYYGITGVPLHKMSLTLPLTIRKSLVLLFGLVHNERSLFPFKSVLLPFLAISIFFFGDKLQPSAAISGNNYSEEPLPTHPLYYC
jgi:hypothetical protein